MARNTTSEISSLIKDDGQDALLSPQRPTLNIPLKKGEIDDWMSQWMMYVMSMMHFTQTENQLYDNYEQNYKQFSGRNTYNMDDITKVNDEETPKDFYTLGLARQKIEQLLGEFLQSPENRSVTTVDPNAVQEKLERKLKMYLNKELKKADEEIDQAVGSPMDPERQDIGYPDDPEKEMESYMDEASLLMNGLIEKLNKVYKLRRKTYPAFLSMLLTTIEHVLVEVRNGKLHLEYVDPRSSYFELPTDEEFMDDIPFFFYYKWIPYAEFIDWISMYAPESKDDVIEKINQTLTGQPGLFDTATWVERTEEGISYVRVGRLIVNGREYRAQKYSKNKEGKEYYKRVKYGYKPKKDEEVDVKRIDDIYEKYVFMGQYITEARRFKCQPRSITEPQKTVIPVAGAKFMNHLGYTHSLYDMLKPIEMMHSEVFYHIRLALSRSGGKAIVYDMSQAPAFIGQNMQKIAYHMKQDGIIPINSAQEGANPSGQNMFKEVDTSLSATVQHMYNLAFFLDQMADKIVGFTPQRQGNVGQYEFVRNTNNAINQSVARTTPYFWYHEQVVKRCYELYSMYAKQLYDEEKTEVFFAGENKQKFLQISPTLLDHDFAFYIRGHYDDSQRKDQVMQMMTAMSQRADDPKLLLSLAKAIEGDSFKEVLDIFENGVEAMIQSNEAMMKHQEQMSQQQSQAIEQAAQKEAETKEKEMVSKENIAEIGARSRENVALIYSDDARSIEDYRQKAAFLHKMLEEEKEQRNQLNTKSSNNSAQGQGGNRGGGRPGGPQNSGQAVQDSQERKQ